ncbi:hypothetical protein COT75_01010 [Candidatus Beckwithbacteria bacterium CG10_big_fil_rev_8_21_14_0_10_34_10]|uniref:Uncharacterized protein n=1 Tax=Candidatus Beckwithbacteria bacterium CG10_big_fil_rev_8_21_14_0_10_34_10 TaxID=1974495 RepID=A0A2H0WAF9_9BACT|nr:MAG: hypothetical protein COT75_01010 [Candidatus Beckwithbacteria bacterium CG10_big_fil_rev_8_21_14_0_10_34_10]
MSDQEPQPTPKETLFPRENILDNSIICTLEGKTSRLIAWTDEINENRSGLESQIASAALDSFVYFGEHGLFGDIKIKDINFVKSVFFKEADALGKVSRFLDTKKGKTDGLVAFPTDDPEHTALVYFWQSPRITWGDRNQGRNINYFVLITKNNIAEKILNLSQQNPCYPYKTLLPTLYPHASTPIPQEIVKPAVNKSLSAEVMEITKDQCKKRLSEKYEQAKLKSQKEWAKLSLIKRLKSKPTTPETTVSGKDFNLKDLAVFITKRLVSKHMVLKKRINYDLIPEFFSQKENQAFQEISQEIVSQEINQSNYSELIGERIFPYIFNILWSQAGEDLIENAVQWSQIQRRHSLENLLICKDKKILETDDPHKLTNQLNNITVSINI